MITARESPGESGREYYFQKNTLLILVWKVARCSDDYIIAGSSFQFIGAAGWLMRYKRCKSVHVELGS